MSERASRSDRDRPTSVIRTYGRGSLLGLLSLPFAYLLAAAGMNGWQQRALRDMEDDAAAMARRGYRVVSSDEYSIRPFGVAWYRVTYERSDPET